MPPEDYDDSVSVVVEDVHVRYHVREDRNQQLRDLARRGFRTRQGVAVDAVNGVSLTVRVGESVGLLGPNGSGKSTLLRCIAGVQPMLSGRVMVRGRPQLLAVNAALDPKLSGRRNIFLGGLAMGLSLNEVTERAGEVIAFAELSESIERPMHTYSSGMKARLAFSIATMVQPPILLIDEALAVGDRKFRRKSLARLRTLQQQAGTLIMVTHNLAEIRGTCERAVWLERGQVRMDGPTEEVTAAYDADE